MKILFVNQFFWPDSSATSQQLTDVASGLAERGHEVTVLCSAGGYAQAASAHAPKGVQIHRVRAVPYVRGKLGRVLSYLSYYASATARGLLLPRQDVVVSLTTPPLISLLGTLIRTVRGGRHFIYEQDMYPDVAVDLGTFTRGGLLDRGVGTLADFARHHADGVIALGECMQERLIARGLDPSQIHVAENWASSEAITPMQRPGNPAELVLLYSGNLGLAHDLDTLTGTMKLLREDDRFRFLFVGSGGRREELEQFCRNESIGSAEFRPYVPRDLLSEGLAAGDIGVVTQHNVCCGSVVPSKVYGIMAAGRPVLFIGPAGATPALVIARHGCGWQIDPGDVFALCRLLLHLACHPAEVRQAGRRARQALLFRYDQPQSIDRLEHILDGSAQAQPQPHPAGLHGFHSGLSTDLSMNAQDVQPEEVLSNP